MKITSGCLVMTGLVDRAWLSRPLHHRPLTLANSDVVSRLELKPWWRSYGMIDEDRAVAVSWTIE
jgi:hypothetical protein